MWFAITSLISLFLVLYHHGKGGRLRRLTDEPAPALLAAWMRLLRTSAGAQMVVATVPATRLESMCVFMSSCREVFARRARLAAVYLAGRRVSQSGRSDDG